MRRAGLGVRFAPTFGAICPLWVWVASWFYEKELVDNGRESELQI